MVCLDGLVSWLVWLLWVTWFWVCSFVCVLLCGACVCVFGYFDFVIWVWVGGMCTVFCVLSLICLWFLVVFCRLFCLCLVLVLFANFAVLV